MAEVGAELVKSKQQMQAEAVRDQCETAMADWAKKHPEDFGAIGVVARLLGETGDASVVAALQPHQCKAVAMLLHAMLGDIQLRLFDREQLEKS
jgi:hypothetical protein